MPECCSQEIVVIVMVKMKMKVKVEREGTSLTVHVEFAAERASGFLAGVADECTYLTLSYLTFGTEAWPLVSTHATVD